MTDRELERRYDQVVAESEDENFPSFDEFKANYWDMKYHEMKDEGMM